MDLDPTLPCKQSWLQSMDNNDLRRIAESEEYQYSQRPAMEIFERVSHRHAFTSAKTFLKLIGVNATSPHLATLKMMDGFNLLHFVAANLAKAPRPLQNDSQILLDWLEILFTALKYGLELSEAPTGTNHHPCGKPPYGSPLFHLVKTFSSHRPIRHSFSTVLHSWLSTVQDAGFDLVEYGEHEDEIWGLCQNRSSQYEPFKAFGNRPIRLQLIYGRCPVNWHVCISRSYVVPVYCLEKMPGTFPQNICLPQKICWHPRYYCNENDKKWRPLTHQIIWRKPKNALDMFMKDQKFFTRPRDSPHDDGSLIALIELRTSRPRASRRRSASVPPRRLLDEYKHLRSGDWDELSRPVKVRTPSWHIGLHFCVYTMAWEYGESHGGVNACSTGVCQQYHADNSSVQAFHAWKHGSFLAEIRDCLDGLPNHNWNFTALLHSGREGCLQGCKNIKLETLKVPAALVPQHPLQTRDRDAYRGVQTNRSPTTQLYFYSRILVYIFAL